MIFHHTPGPWTAYVDVEIEVWVRATLDEPVLCDLVPRDDDAYTQEDVANARLIAAAPELFAALVEGYNLSTFTAAMNFNQTPNTPEFLDELARRIERFQPIAEAAIAKVEGR